MSATPMPPWKKPLTSDATIAPAWPDACQSSLLASFPVVQSVPRVAVPMR
jgi:hypothetical protein